MGAQTKICGFNKAEGGEEPEICKEPVFDSSGRCIFHTPHGKPGFWEAFEKYVLEFEGKYRTLGDEEKNCLDCRRFIFPGTEDYFVNKRFPYDVEFNNSKFRGVVNLRGTEFGGIAHFWHVEFAEEVYLTDAKFLSEVFFLGSDFKGGAYFYYVEFGKRADFLLVKFFDETEFHENVFEGIAWFHNVTFEKRALFRESEFRSGASFMKTRFFSKAIFEKLGTEIRRNEKREILSIKPAEFDFRYVFIDKDGALIFDNLDLGDWALAGTPAIIEASFLDTTWEGSSKPRRKHTRDENLAGVSEISPESAAEVYRRLRRNFETRLSYPKAGDFHTGEMEMRRLGFKEKGWKRIFNWKYVFLQAYRWFGGYGESIRNPIISFIAVGLAFAGLWSLLGFPIPEGETITISHNLGYAVLFSFKTFFTLPGKAFCLVQELVGAFQRAIGVGIITLFILALRRAFRR